jgi:hypothetical protein
MWQTGGSIVYTVYNTTHQSWLAIMFVAPFVVFPIVCHSHNDKMKTDVIDGAYLGQKHGWALGFTKKLIQIFIIKLTSSMESENFWLIFKSGILFPEFYSVPLTATKIFALDKFN